MKFSNLVKYSGKYQKCSVHTHATKCERCCTRIEHLSVKAGNTEILHDVNLHIHCGELTAIVGRNGAGKTTFLRALLDEIPHEGSIHFRNSKSTECTLRPRIGYVPQKLQLDVGSPVSVSDLILSCLTRWPVWLSYRKKDKELVKNVLKSTDSSHLIDRRISDLSGGELQRVMLALALNPLPDILLLDEPVSGVDRQGMMAFYKMVSKLRKENDITILLISHDLDIIGSHADRVVFIENGYATQGKPKEIFESKEFINVFGHITIESEEGYND